MKKGTSYIVVAAMMMGLMLTGCGGNDNSVTKATTEAETEAATEEQDTGTQRKIQRTVKRQKLILQ